jgi:hypothetical protein
MLGSSVRACVRACVRVAVHDSADAAALHTYLKGAIYTDPATETCDGALLIAWRAASRTDSVHPRCANELDGCREHVFGRLISALGQRVALAAPYVRSCGPASSARPMLVCGALLSNPKEDRGADVSALKAEGAARATDATTPGRAGPRLPGARARHSRLHTRLSTLCAWRAPA